MATIKAPFNFVPLNDKVFFPDWADKISQDIPFEDGISGTIEMKITAQTPIFVRNGHTREDADAKNEKYKSFSKTSDNKYFIPATSIKGCIRNVLEIMSFGKITQVDNQSFGLRDLNNNDYRSKMRGIRCGWLQYTDNGYYLYDWGEPGRISVEAIDKKFNTKLSQFVKGDNFKDDGNKTAKYKYMLCNAESSCKVDKFTKDEELQKAKLKTNKIEPRKFYKFGGDQEGILVFTGQPSQRKKVFDRKSGKEKWTGKYYEFVFLKPDRESPIVLSDELVRAFKTIHTESPDFKDFWRKKLYAGERIPVFFKKGGDKVHSIGLAYMYKYPFEKSVLDAIPDEHKNIEKLDLAECVFGYTQKTGALRGRVQFTHAFANGQPTALAGKDFVSATPHPSFYPLYVENGRDWNSAQRIAGRKRYPVRNQADYKNEGTTKMEQTCSMLNKGVSFFEKISFHNLKPVELGALLSAITFHGMNDKCYHSLGFGKAYGFGKVKISDLKLQFVEDTIETYMSYYEDMMGHFVEQNTTSQMNNNPFAALSDKTESNKWLNSMYLQELVAMAIGIPQGMDKKFSYMKMSTTNRDGNEFLNAKKDRESLQRYSKITGQDIAIESVKNKKTEDNSIIQSVPETAESLSYTPANLNVGDIVSAKCIEMKKVMIDSYDYSIQLVLPKYSAAKISTGTTIKVRIKQISKAGKICQVELV